MNLEKLNVITLTESGGLQGKLLLSKRDIIIKENKLWQEEETFATLSKPFANK